MYPPRSLELKMVLLTICPPRSSSEDILSRSLRALKASLDGAKRVNDAASSSSEVELSFASSSGAFPSSARNEVRPKSTKQSSTESRSTA